MKDRINISAWIDNFLKGRYDKKESFNDDVKTQIEAGWYNVSNTDENIIIRLIRKILIALGKMCPRQLVRV